MPDDDWLKAKTKDLQHRDVWLGKTPSQDVAQLTEFYDAHKRNKSLWNRGGRCKGQPIDILQALYVLSHAFVVSGGLSLKVLTAGNFIASRCEDFTTAAIYKLAIVLLRGLRRKLPANNVLEMTELEWA